MSLFGNTKETNANQPHTHYSTEEEIDYLHRLHRVLYDVVLYYSSWGFPTQYRTDQKIYMKAHDLMELVKARLFDIDCFMQLDENLKKMRDDE